MQAPGEGSAAAGQRLLAMAMRPVIGALLRRYLARQSRPTFDDRALVVGSNPIRVLVVGAGLAVGYGNTRNGPSLPEHLAAEIFAALHRGVIVQTRAQASVRLEHTIALMGMTGASTFDVVIWSPTLEETFRGGSGRWSRHLRKIVEHIRATGNRRVRIILMGVPHPEGDHPLHRIGATLARGVNARIEEVADRFERVEFAPVPARRIDAADTPLFDPEYQRTVIEGLTALLAPRRDEDSTRERSRRNTA